MVTIASYSFPYEAQIARAKLECAGIQAFIADEHTINTQWLYSNAMGGVRLQVPESLAEQAIKVLDEDADPELLEELGYEAIPCPNCNSLNTEYYSFRGPAFLSWLCLDVALFPARDGVYCLDCKQRSKT